MVVGLALVVGQRVPHHLAQLGLLHQRRRQVVALQQPLAVGPPGRVVVEQQAQDVALVGNLIDFLDLKWSQKDSSKSNTYELLDYLYCQLKKSTQN